MLDSMNDIPRKDITQGELNVYTGNYSFLDLSGLRLPIDVYTNESFSGVNFNNADISDCVFEGKCDFSHSIGLDNAVLNSGTSFTDDTFVNADLPPSEYLKGNCNLRRYTEKELNDYLTAMEPQPVEPMGDV